MQIPSSTSQETGQIRRFSGMAGFTVVWIGQMLSLLGTNMTQFALSIWAWEVTGQATALALVGFFGFLPIILASPIAGVIVDRHDRRKIMILADLAAGIPTIAVLLIYSAASLQVWYLFITGAVSATFQAFHFPAYSAAVTMMLPKKHYARASGMLAAAQFVAIIFSPIVAGILIAFFGLFEGVKTVMIIDITTFVLAITVLLFIHIPNPPASQAKGKGLSGIGQEIMYGFRYIYERKSLLGLLLAFFSSNLIGTFGNTLLTPMILARTGNNSLQLGTVMASAGAGGLIGSIVLTIWGGPRRKVAGVLFGMVFMSLLGGFFVGLGREVYMWSITAFLALFFMPITNGSSQAIWQAKVAPDVQGRVFSTRLLIAQASAPIAMLLAGPLADRYFEPAMMPGGSLAPVFGGLVNTGAGAGMALMLVFSGIIGSIIGLVGYSIRVIREAEQILPDYAPDAQKEKETLISIE